MIVKSYAKYHVCTPSSQGSYGKIRKIKLFSLKFKSFTLFHRSIDTGTCLIFSSGTSFKHVNYDFRPNQEQNTIVADVD